MAIGAGTVQWVTSADALVTLNVFVGTGIAKDDICNLGSSGGTDKLPVIAVDDADSDGFATAAINAGYVIITTVYGLDSAGPTGCGCTIAPGGLVYLEGSATTYQVNKSSTGGSLLGRYLGIYSAGKPLATTIAVLATATNAMVLVQR